MLERLSRKKRKDTKKKNKATEKKQSDSSKDLKTKTSEGLESISEEINLDDKGKKLKKSTDVDLVKEEVDIPDNLYSKKEESANIRINFLITNLEGLVADEKVFEISEIVRKNTETTTLELIEALEAAPTFLNENEFVFKRLLSVKEALEELVKKAKVSREFDALLMSLNTILSQVNLTNLQKTLLEENPVDITQGNLDEVKESLSKGAEIITYIDNRDPVEKQTSVITEEQLKAIEEQEAENKKQDEEEKVDEAKEYLEQSAKIKEALQAKSTHLISGKFRFLSAEERIKMEKEEFKSKFLGYVRKPSIYEMSIFELQRFASQKGLQNFEGMSRDELLAFIENPLMLYGEKHITQNPYITRLKMELADNVALKNDVLIAEAKVVESLKAAKAYSSKVKISAVTWQAFFVITLILVIAAIIGILVFFLVF